MALANGITSVLPVGNQTQGINRLLNEQSSFNNPGQVKESEFSTFLQKSLEKLDGLQKTADSASSDLVSGKIQDVHTVMLALEKANLGFSLASEVRNKVLDAYHEVMRMQL